MKNAEVKGKGQRRRGKKNDKRYDSKCGAEDHRNTAEAVLNNISGLLHTSCHSLAQQFKQVKSPPAVYVAQFVT
ncbi:MAG: hypothetical protein R6U27_09540 [Desulfobacterales bacterium]